MPVRTVDISSHGMRHTLPPVSDRLNIAYDLMSRRVKLSGLRHMQGGEELMPFVASFHGHPSTYVWEDEIGVVHDIQQEKAASRATP